MSQLPDVSDAEIEHLNRNFYEKDPSHYIHVRLMSLIALGSDPEAFAARFDGRGVAYGRVRVTATGPNFITDVDSYITVE